jgi:hypothetical protein
VALSLPLGKDGWSTIRSGVFGMLPLQSKGTHSSSSLNVVSALDSLLQTTGGRFPSTSNISARGMRKGSTVPK